MRETLIYLLCCWMGCVCSCSSGQQTKESEDVPIVVSNEIDVSTTINTIKDQIYLSEWVDSITYIPLETRSNNLLGGTGASLTPEYIFCGNHCFDWNGNYIFQIGKLGQGPCEEPGFGIGNVVLIDDFFYTCGMKFIEYDRNGVCTGKEKNLFRVENANVVGKFANIGSMKRIGSTMIGFDSPEAVYFFNTDFEIVNTYPIMEWPHPYISTSYDGGNSMIHYDNTIVFYNYYTDTVYHATETTLIPKWIIKLDEKDKLSTNYLYNFRDLLIESFVYYENGNLDQAPLCKLSDNKVNVSSVYETDNYLFLSCNRIVLFRTLRNLSPTDPPFMISFNKSTGKTIGAKKIVDDIGGMDTFFPSWGVYEDKMLSTIWPYELDEFIRDKQEKGQKVDPRLLDLMNQVDIEDNPILIVAHLKTF